jgi:hypothetical protein
VTPKTGLDDVERRKSRHYRDSNTDHSTVQQVANRYTDCAIPAPIIQNVEEANVFYLSYIYAQVLNIPLFPGVKQQGREADHSSPASAAVKKMWIYTSTPPYAFMA